MFQTFLMRAMLAKCFHQNIILFGILGNVMNRVRLYYKIPALMWYTILKQRELKMAFVWIYIVNTSAGATCKSIFLRSGKDYLYRGRIMKKWDVTLYFAKFRKHLFTGVKALYQLILDTKRSTLCKISRKYCNYRMSNGSK